MPSAVEPGFSSAGLDIAALDRLFHRDYRVVQPGGSIEGKAEILASFRNGMRFWRRAEVDELDIHIVGQSAIVIGRWHALGRNGAVDFDHAARFLSVWIHEDGRWQNVAYQSTEIDGGILQ